MVLVECSGDAGQNMRCVNGGRIRAGGEDGNEEVVWRQKRYCCMCLVSFLGATTLQADAWICK